MYTFYQHIIYVYLHGAPDQVLKDFVNHSLEGSPYVLESEGHHFAAVNSPTSSEGIFVFILWVHVDLVIAGIDIHEAKVLVARHRFY